MLGKISRLSPEIRNQLNRRLANGEPSDPLLAWLNSLPETRAVIADHFDGQPITQQNLSDYRCTTFRRWQMRQAAVEFVSEETTQDTQSDQFVATPLVDHLVHWIATRFAAAAQTAPLPESPEDDLREMRHYLSDIVALRRGDLVARRLAIEQQRLALEQANAEPEQERLFWEWTKRPDVQSKLYPHRDPDKARRDVVRVLDHHLLGINTPGEEFDPNFDPACLI